MGEFAGSKKFWEKKILGWEHSRYAKSRFFYPLAWTIRARLRRAAQVIVQRTPSDSRILELGCGSGYLAEKLSGKGYRYSGCDFAANAIVVAQARVQDPAFTFFVSDVTSGELPGADLTVFMGLTDWLSAEQLLQLLQSIPSASIFFSYTHEFAWSPYRFYRRLMDGPGGAEAYRARTYSRNQIEQILERAGYRYEVVSYPLIYDPGCLVWAERKK